MMVDVNMKRQLTSNDVLFNPDVESPEFILGVFRSQRGNPITPGEIEDILRYEMQHQCRKDFIEAMRPFYEPAIFSYRGVPIKDLHCSYTIPKDAKIYDYCNMKWLEHKYPTYDEIIESES
jgi:hypothetical protein